MDLEEGWESQPDSQVHPCSHVQVAGVSVIPEKGSRAGLCRWVLHSLECSSSWVMKQPAPVQFLLLCQNVVLLVPLMIFYRNCKLSWSFMEIIHLPELHNINQSAAPVQAAG